MCCTHTVRYAEFLPSGILQYYLVSNVHLSARSSKVHHNWHGVRKYRPLLQRLQQVAPRVPDQVLTCTRQQPDWQRHWLRHWHWVRHWRPPWHSEERPLIIKSTVQSFLFILNVSCGEKKQQLKSKRKNYFLKRALLSFVDQIRKRKSYLS